ncbi:MAG: DUF4398 domain-containing protein [Anaeromyxobacter sp.]
MRLLLTVLAIAALAGCGPVRSTANLSEAEVALEAARAAGARDSATFEYVSAEAYLRKAKETANRARYESSIEFAKKATQLAKEAREKALSSTTRAPEAP